MKTKKGMSIKITPDTYELLKKHKIQKGVPYARAVDDAMKMYLKKQGK